MKNKVYWDTFTGKYQHGDQKHRVFMLDLLSKKGVKAILDVGCGTGPLWEMIRDSKDRGETKWDFTYLGTDYSNGMVEAAKSNFPDVHWQVEDARNLSLNDDSWECVVMLHSLDHLDDYEAAIKEAARVSSKYVCIVLWRSFVSEGTRLNDRNMMGKGEGEDPWEDTYLHEYSRDSLTDAFKKAGLEIEEEVYGEEINSDQSKYNHLFLLRK